MSQGKHHWFCNKLIKGRISKKFTTVSRLVSASSRNPPNRRNEIKSGMSEKSTTPSWFTSPRMKAKSYPITSKTRMSLSEINNNSPAAAVGSRIPRDGKPSRKCDACCPVPLKLPVSSKTSSPSLRSASIEKKTPELVEKSNASGSAANAASLLRNRSTVENNANGFSSPIPGAPPLRSDAAPGPASENVSTVSTPETNPNA